MKNLKAYLEDCCGPAGAATPANTMGMGNPGEIGPDTLSEPIYPITKTAKALRQNEKKKKKKIKESLFDKDLVKRQPYYFDFIKEQCKTPRDKAEFFLKLLSLMDTPHEQLPEWWVEDYEENKDSYDFVLNELRQSFKKDRFITWFNIDADDFEEMGDEMDDEQVEDATNKLHEFFSKGVVTYTGGMFIEGKGKLPTLITNIIKGTDWWDNKFDKIDRWAVCYWEDDPALTVYACPKSLNLLIKKLLY